MRREGLHKCLVQAAVRTGSVTTRRSLTSAYASSSKRSPGRRIFPDQKAMLRVIILASMGREPRPGLGRDWHPPPPAGSQLPH